MNMLTNMIGRTLKNVSPRSIKAFPPARMGMATTIDPRGLSPAPPKQGRRVKSWDRATFTIKVNFKI